MLEGLSDADRRAVQSSARRRRFARREVIFHEGDLADSVHLIAKGRVTIHTTTPLGDVSLLSIMTVGEAFGELALVLPSARRTATATALEPSETLVVYRDVFEDLRAQHPSIDRFLVSLLSTQVARLSQQLAELAFYGLEARVTRKLVELASLFAATAVPGDPIVIPLTQEDMAGLTGATRPRVNEVLRKAEAAGVVALGRGKIEITDLDALRRRAGRR